MTENDGLWFFDKWISDVIIGATIDWYVRKHYVLDMYNKETVIRLNTLDDIQEFVGAASKCDFDIDLKYRQILIDAKSLLGVIGIGTNNDFKVCYMGDDQAFDNVVDKFTVA